MSDVGSSAGCCTGVNSYISLPFGTTIIPPGCCPVVLFIPVQPCATLITSELFIGIPLSSLYFLTYPIAVLPATVPTVPALNVVPFPNITSVYLCAFA